MAITFKQFNTAQELVDYLNDIVLSKPLLSPVQGLNGLTLILGTTTVTFSDTTGNGLTLPEIVSQINAEVTGAAALRNYGHDSYYQHVPKPVQLALVKDGVVISKDGTANGIFGFSTSADTTVGANKVAGSEVVQITCDANGSRYTVFHE